MYMEIGKLKKTMAEEKKQLDEIPLYNLSCVKEPEKPFALLNGALKQMTSSAREQWRWRMIWLRAALDLEITKSQGLPTSITDEYFEEICRISHAENAELSVFAPSRRSFKKRLGLEA